MAQYLKAEVFREHYAEAVRQKKCTDQLLKDFRLIADNVYTVITKGNHHPDEEVCKWYAIEEAWKKWHKYDEERSANIFAYFTQMIKNDIMIHYNYLRGNKETVSMNLFDEGTNDEE